MGQGYIRNDTSNNIANGNVINASDLDGEFDAIVAAFVAATGHTHNGTAAEGGVIEVTGPNQEYVSTAIGYHPKVTDTYDLGSVTEQWKDLYVHGVAYLDSIDLNGTVLTTTGAELNYVSGVTSAIQTQLDTKGTVLSLSDLSITSSAAELNILNGVTANTTEINKLDGLTATTTQLNYVTGVTSAIQTQLNAKMTPTYTGDVTITGEIVADSYNESYSSLSGTSPAANCENGNHFSLTLTGNSTFTFTNPPASGTSFTFSIEIKQDAGASGYTVTWPASVDWPAATAPTLTATASAIDFFVFTTRDGGTTWYGFTAGQALA